MPIMKLSDQQRDDFDRIVQEVMDPMPAAVHELLREVTMYIEDHPPRSLLRQMGLRHRTQLCGLYTGVPLTNRHVELSGVLSDAIYLYREGILDLARDASGRVDPDELRRQIRITILHELGHHHGLDEDELQRLGY
jgi:predicted Zn-dependent protease with MMP-like domain